MNRKFQAGILLTFIITGALLSVPPRMQSLWRSTDEMLPEPATTPYVGPKSVIEDREAALLMAKSQATRLVDVDKFPEEYQEAVRQLLRRTKIHNPLFEDDDLFIIIRTLDDKSDYTYQLEDLGATDKNSVIEMEVCELRAFSRECNVIGSCGRHYLYYDTIQKKFGSWAYVRI